MDFRLTDEQRLVRDLAREFARREIAPVAAEYDRQAEFPYPIYAKARELGLANLAVPARYGGGDLDPFSICLVAEELAWGCTGIAAAITLNNLVADAILLAGTAGQQDKYLGILGSGGFGAYCVTESGAGSDVAAIQSVAYPHAGGYLLQGTKIWISNAAEAGFFIVFAKLDPAAGHKGITAFIVDRDCAGVTVSKKLSKMGQRASDACEVVFDNVYLLAENRLGDEGQGFRLAMQVFDGSRPMVAAFAVGLAQRALDESVAYARERRTFGQAILDFQAIGFKIAEMGMRSQAARLLTWDAAWRATQRERNTLQAAYAKAFAADTAMWAATEAVQVFGAYGYSTEYPVEKLMRDAKVLQIYEGTSEIQRTIMVRELSKGISLS
ncbi:MAG: acyl-CoA dehydrogenase [Chloroflexi bacterium]|nr:acyl-CoA dehydrogenase [Chloroflexota bacterium]